MWQVVDAPEILTVIGKIPYLSDFMNSLYDCQYKSFFTAFGEYPSHHNFISGVLILLAIANCAFVLWFRNSFDQRVVILSHTCVLSANYLCCVYSAGLTEHIKLDRYLHPHFRYYMREIRTVVYSQFLESYKSVTIEAMAKAFGVTVDFIDM